MPQKQTSSGVDMCQHRDRSVAVADDRSGMHAVPGQSNQLALITPRGVWPIGSDEACGFNGSWPEEHLAEFLCESFLAVENKWNILIPFSLQLHQLHSVIFSLSVSQTD